MDRSEGWAGADDSYRIQPEGCEGVDRENFEKCVVNKAEVEWDGNFEGSDTATVCYGDVEVTELPETGAVSTLAIAGLGLIIAGYTLKKR